ncbi:MAG: diacylglycerol/lipid kinase family protein [Pyrinomonadaceae bacterium]
MPENSTKNGKSELPLVIVNPKSAGGSTKDSWANKASDLRAHFGAFQVAFTKKAGDGIELAKRHSENGRRFIIACGGDGTINEVANGILQSGKVVEMGILPSGTGGDFRKTLNIPQETREAARVLQTGETKQIDVGRVTFQNFENETVSRYFLNVASFGLSAAINEKVKEKDYFKWLPIDAIRGKAKYALSTLEKVLVTDYLTVRVKIDDTEEKHLNTLNFCVCNARYFGGGMKIAPNAKLADGFFDVVNIGDIKTLKILFNAHTLYRGTHLNLTEVKSSLAKKVEISPLNDQDIHIETDGELPGKLPAVFEIVPHALRVRVPKIM